MNLLHMILSFSFNDSIFILLLCLLIILTILEITLIKKRTPNQDRSVLDDDDLTE